MLKSYIIGNNKNNNIVKTYLSDLHVLLLQEEEKLLALKIESRLISIGKHLEVFLHPAISSLRYTNWEGIRSSGENAGVHWINGVTAYRPSRTEQSVSVKRLTNK